MPPSRTFPSLPPLSIASRLLDATVLLPRAPRILPTRWSNCVHVHLPVPSRTTPTHPYAGRPYTQPTRARAHGAVVAYAFYRVCVRDTFSGNVKIARARIESDSLSSSASFRRADFSPSLLSRKRKTRVLSISFNRAQRRWNRESRSTRRNVSSLSFSLVEIVSLFSFYS